MDKEIFIIRHCEAEGQSSESNLTERGSQQAIHLARFFSSIKIDQIISSPFMRAIQSIEPTSQEKKLNIEIEDRLSERILSSTNLPDWVENLKATYIDLELKFNGGESSQEATNRAINVIEDIIKSNSQKTIIVTHGNLMTLILKYFNNEFGFENWKNLSNPDVFLLQFKSSEVVYKRLWQEDIYLKSLK